MKKSLPENGRGPSPFLRAPSPRWSSEKKGTVPLSAGRFRIRTKISGKHESAACLAALLVTLLVAPGCPRTDSSGATAGPAATTQAEQGQYRAPLLSNALYVLNKLEQFDEQPALEQVVDRLNQWARGQEFNVEWKRDPLFATLPEKYQSAPWFEKLEDKSYDHDLDADFLEEVTWLRDISNHARGRERDDLAVATALFDWTIRNIQLIDPPKPQSPVQQALLDQVLRRVPAEVLLQGEGVAAQRAWVFVLLGRQQKLDIVMLAVPDPDRPDQPRPWLPALVHDGQLYLFDTTLGLPIPGPGGKGIATLTQAAEVESVLASLDLDESHHYPFKATEAKQAMALVEASPGYLSRRMKVLESQLAGDERVVLTASPEQIARRLKGIPHLAPEVKLWAAPYEAYAQRQLEKTGPRQFKELLALEMAPFKVPGFHGSRSTMMKPGERQEALDELVRQGENQIDSRKTVVSRPLRIVFPLWAGRLLHFRGDYDGESGAKHFYMMARPGNDQLGEHVAELVSDYQIANEQAAPRDIIQKYDRVVFRRKQNATYWLGLISFDEGQYQTAEDYFRMAPLEIRPDVPSQWIAGAKYNLARACEAAGRSAEAIKLLEEDDSPQRYGNRLRARRLKEAAKATP